MALGVPAHLYSRVHSLVRLPLWNTDFGLAAHRLRFSWLARRREIGHGVSGRLKQVLVHDVAFGIWCRDLPRNLPRWTNRRVEMPTSLGLLWIRQARLAVNQRVKRKREHGGF